MGCYHSSLWNSATIRRKVLAVKRLIAIVLVCLVGAGAQPTVSLVALIAAPERYHGKQVVVSGFMYLQRERSALYIGKADFQHALFKNAVYLVIPNESFERIYRFNGCYVEVRGTFNGKATGHVGAYSGELNVKEVSPIWTATVPAGAQDGTDSPNRK
jgi:hypothetical protein